MTTEHLSEHELKIEIKNRVDNFVEHASRWIVTYGPLKKLFIDEQRVMKKEDEILNGENFTPDEMGTIWHWIIGGYSNWVALCKMPEYKRTQTLRRLGENFLDPMARGRLPNKPKSLTKEFNMDDVENAAKPLWVKK